MIIAPLDSADSAAMVGWYDLVVAVTAHDQPDFPTPSRAEHMARFEHPWPTSTEEALLARDGAGYHYLTSRGHQPGVTSIRVRCQVADRAATQTHADGYSLVQWRDAAPEEIVEDVARVAEPAHGRRTHR
ncbi:hypothetical protein ACIA5C_24045 [Actinoplanes sp. NPDC051343]|uniref:hypothetical protein n=1 Tax=Actinoplanes sp. NPDC051343 TaxID=3363906 RepID=UPI0037B75D8B